MCSQEKKAVGRFVAEDLLDISNEDAMASGEDNILLFFYQLDKNN